MFTMIRPALAVAYCVSTQAALFGDQESEQALRRSHSEVFEKWLNLPLQDQKEDLDEYLSSLDQDRRVVIEAWTKLTPYQTLAPETAQPVEKDLFLSDMETVLSLLRGEFGVTRLGE